LSVVDLVEQIAKVIVGQSRLTRLNAQLNEFLRILDLFPLVLDPFGLALTWKVDQILNE
jgi:hypothetical protein